MFVHENKAYFICELYYLVPEWLNLYFMPLTIKVSCNTTGKIAGR
jgi:hypothetical protein